MPDIYALRVFPRKGEIRGKGLTPDFRADDNSAMPEEATGLHRYLRAWRKSRGLTLERLANAIGSKASTLAGWETGARAVDLKDLERLAEFYSVHPAALLMAPDENPRFERMRRASTLAERMEPETAEDWLKMGERLARPQPKD